MTSHVNFICKKASFGIRKIGSLRKYLDRDSTEMLVHSFITSQLDYCNSLLYGLPDYQTDKIQRIQNSAGRLVTLTKNYEHISPILDDLHWLPVKKRIMFKILLMTYKAVSGTAPLYICELINVKVPTRTLRSNTAPILQRQTIRTVSYGRRSFEHAAPELWNPLPAHIRNAPTIAQFKTALKTHLFNL